MAVWSSGKEFNVSIFQWNRIYSLLPLLLVGITRVGPPGKCCCECTVRYKFLRWYWNKEYFIAIQVDLSFLSFRSLRPLACHLFQIFLLVLPYMRMHFRFILSLPDAQGVLRRWHHQLQETETFRLTLGILFCSIPN